MLGKQCLDVYDEPLSRNVSVSKIILHPDWNANDSRYHADIAMIIMKESIEFNNFIQPVCLPNEIFNRQNFSGFIAGWGRSNEFERHAMRPSQLEIPVNDDWSCFTKFNDLAWSASIVRDSMFCGGYENQNKAPCTGDSGGGMFFKDLNTDSYSIRGIISASLMKKVNEKVICNVNAFQLYTNLGYYLEWIRQYLVVKFECTKIG
jgi:serine protease 56